MNFLVVEQEKTISKYILQGDTFNIICVAKVIAYFPSKPLFQNF